MAQNWDEVLYPPFRATIRGEYYGVITQDHMDEECYNIACRAIAAFKFPKISTEYTTYYANWNETSGQYDITTDTVSGVPHGSFINTLTFNELEVILAWMKVYWCEYQISNADNFEDMYTDVNIKTYSRANAVEKNTKLMAEFRSYAKDLENRYSRVNANRRPSLGDVNADE